MIKDSFRRKYGRSKSKIKRSRKAMNNHGYLNFHKQSKHKRFMYGCDQCGYKAAGKEILKKHISCKHEEINYRCDHGDYN